MLQSTDPLILVNKRRAWACNDRAVDIPFDRLLAERRAVHCAGCASTRERQAQAGGGT
ncbi:MAG: hypothetical protein NTW37_01600 [Proteobacteria bacterium]|jgi:RNA polymerase-binding transcription factor DksA|nr:hypothetical protein [Pseudomonadota bacterium]